MLLSRVPFKQKSHGVSSLLPYICSFHILLHLCTYLLYFTKRIANSESMARRHSGCKIQKLGWDCTVKLEKFRGHAPHENATLKSKIWEFGVIEQFCATCWVSIREEWLSIFVIFKLVLWPQYRIYIGLWNWLPTKKDIGNPKKWSRCIKSIFGHGRFLQRVTLKS